MASWLLLPVGNLLGKQNDPTYDWRFTWTELLDKYKHIPACVVYENCHAIKQWKYRINKLQSFLFVYMESRQWRIQGCQPCREAPTPDTPTFKKIVCQNERIGIPRGGTSCGSLDPSMEWIPVKLVHRHQSYASCTHRKRFACTFKYKYQPIMNLHRIPDFFFSILKT